MKIKGDLQMTDNERQSLIQAALNVRENAYAPYSGFYVGAALLTESGKLFTGTNVENSSFPVGVCAERSAFAAAISSGERKFTAICVTGEKKNNSLLAADYCMPCGMCRQFMTEFCAKDFEIISAKTPDDFQVYHLSELMPGAFMLFGALTGFNDT